MTGALVCLNGWEPTWEYPPGCYRCGEFIVLHGGVTGGPHHTVACVIPSEFRPSASLLFNVEADGQPALLRVERNGCVTPLSAGRVPFISNGHPLTWARHVLGPSQGGEMTQKDKLIEHLRTAHPDVRTNESFVDLRKLHRAVHVEQNNAEGEL
jgi:hypothetical protein